MKSEMGYSCGRILKSKPIALFAICIAYVITLPAWGSNQYSVQTEIDLKAQPFELEQVKLLDGPFRDAMLRDKAYLMSLEPDRLLAWFRKEAGLEQKGKVYGGWEARGVAGHCLGHYLSACAMLYASEQDQDALKRVNYVVEELALCQAENGNGYVGAIPEGKRIFKEVAAGQISSKGFDLNGGWVPWYTMHKIYAGLVDAYLLCDNEKALEVLTKLCDWAVELTENLDEDQWQKMLACEHGGMNEALADAYAITGNPKYLELAEKFYHQHVLNPLSRQEDKLEGLHANTQVPKVIGAARLYELTQKPEYKMIAEFFWDRVVHHYSYANGGNSADEHFGPADKLSERMHDTTETCNTYNMLKLTEHLFSWHANGEMADYYELALYNHILAHQHPKTGMFKYKGFLDMPARKNFSTPFDSFWCCVGTGMENHVKYGQAIYFHGQDSLYVNLFIASELNWKDKGLVVRQRTDFPNDTSSKLTFECDKPVKMTLKIRRPAWCNRMSVQVNGKKHKIDSDSQFVEISRTFRDGDVVDLQMPMSLRIEPMPDKANRIAFLYGPVLLATEMQDFKNLPVLVGDTDQLLRNVEKSKTAPLDFLGKGIARFLEEGGEKVEDIHMIPLYQVVDQPYTVYMDTFTADEWKDQQDAYKEQIRQQKLIDARTVDVLRIGEMQPERDHNLDGENTRTGSHQGRNWRDAADGGWFAFDMKTDPDKKQELWVSYWGSDGGQRVFDILIGDTVIATQKLENNKPGQFFEIKYLIPRKLTQGKESVRVRFQAHPGQTAGGVFGCRMLIQEWNIERL